MIRHANKFDIDAIVEMLKHYRDCSPLEILQQTNDEKYIRKLISQIIAGQGFILLPVKDDVPVGMLMAAKIPNVWNPKTIQCSEIAYWIEPEYRGGSYAYKLLLAYVQECKELVAQGAINFYTITKMVNSSDLKFDRFGFSKLEEIWVQ